MRPARAAGPVPSILADGQLRALITAAYRQARRLGAGHEDAEDIAQEVALLLVQGQPVASPWSWMAVVVRHRVYGLHRALGSGREVAAADAFAHDPWAGRELWLDVRAAAARLGPRARAALLMSVRGHSEREIAAALGCSIKAVEKCLHKTRRRLRLLACASSVRYRRTSVARRSLPRG